VALAPPGSTQNQPRVIGPKLEENERITAQRIRVFKERQAVKIAN